MDLYEKLSLTLRQAEKGEIKLIDFYIGFWRSGVLLKPQQYSYFIERLTPISRPIPQGNCWLAFTESYFYTFFPGNGNAFDKATETIELFRQQANIHGEGATQCLLTIYFKNIGQLDKAMENVEKAIKNIGDDKTYIQFLFITYYQGGEIQHLLKDYDTAIGYFNKGLELTGGEDGMDARLLNGIGTVYKDSNRLDLSLEYFQRSLKKVEKANNFLLESKNYADIGNYYFHKKDFEQSLLFQQKSLKIRQERNLNNALITNYIELAELYLNQNNTSEALNYATLALKLATEANVIIKLYNAHRILSSIYEATGNTLLALEHFKKYHQVNDEVHSQESARKIKQISMHHQVETMQKEKEIFKLRNVELKSVLDEIGASVRYARRIQEAILPSARVVKEHLPNAFIIYKPKDIVAGDFYWIEGHNDLVLFAAADCTGHGVPGALVSVVCSNALNRALKEYDLTDPGLLLNKTRELVIDQFQKSDEEMSDGMDISLCVLNKKNNTLLWAGANNPLWIIRSGELLETRPDKQPIGKYFNSSSFTTNSIQLRKKDLIYIFTDGFADQFGGEHGKKFKTAEMKKLLLGMASKPMEEQKTLISQAFESWRGDLEQVDDVCFIGVEY